MKLASTSTAAASNAQKMFEIALSGTNGTSAQSTYGAYISNTHAGTTSTNYGLYATASGGTTNNYAIEGATSGTVNGDVGVYGHSTGASGAVCAKPSLSEHGTLAGLVATAYGIIAPLWVPSIAKM